MVVIFKYSDCNSINHNIKEPFKQECDKLINIRGLDIEWKTLKASLKKTLKVKKFDHRHPETNIILTVVINIFLKEGFWEPLS